MAAAAAGKAATSTDNTQQQQQPPTAQQQQQQQQQQSHDQIQQQQKPPLSTQPSRENDTHPPPPPPPPQATPTPVAVNQSRTSSTVNDTTGGATRDITATSTCVADLHGASSVTTPNRPADTMGELDTAVTATTGVGNHRGNDHHHHGANVPDDDPHVMTSICDRIEARSPAGSMVSPTDGCISTSCKRAWSPDPMAGELVIIEPEDGPASPKQSRMTPSDDGDSVMIVDATCSSSGSDDETRITHITPVSPTPPPPPHITSSSTPQYPHHHLQPHHASTILPTRTYSCKICGQSTTSSRQHLLHLKHQHHIELTIYECDLCDYATQYKQKLPRHRKCHLAEGASNATVASSGSSVVPNGMNAASSGVYNNNPMISILKKSDRDESAIEQNSNSGAGGSVPTLIRQSSEGNEYSAMYAVQQQQQHLLQRDQQQQREQQQQQQQPWNNSSSIIKVEPDKMKPVKKTPMVREAVDPAKYLAIHEEDGLKYACSKCGNKYKWRKSLNKHWKEKHDGETPPGANSRFTTLNVPSLKNGSSSPDLAMHAVPRSEHTTAISQAYSKPATMVPEATSPDQVLKTLKQMTPMLPYPYGRPFYPPLPSTHPSALPADLAAIEKNYLSQYLSLLAATAAPPKAHHLAAFYPRFSDLHNKDLAASYNALYRSAMLKSDALASQAGGILDLSMKDKTPERSVHGKGESVSPIVLQDEPLDFSMKVSDDSSNEGEANDMSDVKLDGQDIRYDVQNTTLPTRKQCFLCLKDFVTDLTLNEHFIEKHMTTINEQIQSDIMDETQLDNESEIKKFEYLCQYLVRSENPDVITCIVCGYAANRQLMTSHLIDFHYELAKGVEIKARAARSSDGDDDILDDENGVPACEHCGFRAKTHSDASRHVLVHLMNRSYACSKCGFSTQHEHELKAHIDKYHIHEQLLATSVPARAVATTAATPSTGSGGGGGGAASSVTSTPASAPTPARGSRRDKQNGDILLPYKCSVCEYRARWPSEITQHMKNHSDDKPFHCPRCKYKSKWKWDVVKHLKRCGGGTIKDVIDTTKMKQDNPSTAVEKVSIPHVVRDTAPVSAVVTAAAATATPEVVSSQRDPSRSPANNKTPALCKFFCSQCPFIGNSPAELKRHSRVHSDEKPFLCKTCGYRSKWKCDLKKHVKNYNHQPEIDFDKNPLKEVRKAAAGSLVPATQPTVLPIQQPILTPNVSNGTDDADVTQLILYKCKQCPYVTHKKNTLEIHMKIHLPANEKYKCKQCDVVSADLSSFLQHKISHASDTPDQSACPSPALPLQPHKPPHQPHESEGADDEVVVQGVTLRVTRRGNKKVYNCPKCPFTHNNVGNATRHARQHGSRHKHTCPRCDYSVDQRRYLTNHINTVHPPLDSNHRYRTRAARRAIREGHSRHSGTLRAKQPASKRYTTAHNAVKVVKLRIKLRAEKQRAKKHCKLFMCRMCHYSTARRCCVHLHTATHKSVTITTATDHARNAATNNNSTQVCHNKPRNSRKQAKKALRRVPRDEQEDDLLIDATDGSVIIGPWRCPACPYQCDDDALRDAHLACHEHCYQYRCSVCTYSSDNNMALSQHALLHAMQPPPPLQLLATPNNTRPAITTATTTTASPPISCDNMKELMRYEINRETSPAKIYRCAQCPYNTSDHTTFIQHYNSHSSTVVSPDGGNLVSSAATSQINKCLMINEVRKNNVHTITTADINKQLV